MTTLEPSCGPLRRNQPRSGERHWFRITGLPGWKRAQLGLPAFGAATCVPHPGTESKPARLALLTNHWRRVLALLSINFRRCGDPSNRSSLPIPAENPAGKPSRETNKHIP